MPMSDHRGKLLIIVIFGVAFAMSGYAWWHQYQAGRRSAHFWGLEAMRVIKTASRVEFVPLDASASTERAERMLLPGGLFAIGEARDISQSRGLIHARHALVDDLSYAWTESSPAAANWQFLLRFESDAGIVHVALDLRSDVVYFVEGRRSGRLVPHIADGFRKKQSDWEAGR